MIYVLFLVAAVCLYHPAAATELNSLIPVETLWITKENLTLTVEGESVKGSGVSWETAMEDLQEAANGEVFLETVDRIVISVEAADCLKELRDDGKLRPSVQLYLLRGEASKTLDQFTAAHESEATVENEGRIPVIEERDGRYRIAGTEQGAA